VETVWLNDLIHCRTDEIQKIQREVKKNGEQLERADGEREEMHKKCRNVFREVEEKKEVSEKKERKIEELDHKIVELKSKLAPIAQSGTQ
jgi:peptidoglycan hydrolase CwlO-like protein